MSLTVNQISTRLLKYGFQAQSLSNKQLHNEIIAVYELLQLKVQENMLLKKETLDLQLQINTIQDLFSSEPPYQENNSQAHIAYPDQQTAPLQQLIFSTHQPPRISESQTSQISDQNDVSHQNELQNSSWTLNGTAQKTQKTQRKMSKKKATNLEDKIEKLFCQNQHILQRLEQLEENLNAQNAQKTVLSGFDKKNSKGRIQYVKQGKGQEDNRTNCTSHRASIYKWSSMNTATSRSSLNGKVRYY